MKLLILALALSSCQSMKWNFYVHKSVVSSLDTDSTKFALVRITKPKKVATQLKIGDTLTIITKR